MTDQKQVRKDEKSRPFVFRVAKEEAAKLVDGRRSSDGNDTRSDGAAHHRARVGLVVRTATVRRRVANADLLRQGWATWEGLATTSIRLLRT